jgi:hypothetical protein
VVRAMTLQHVVGAEYPKNRLFNALGAGKGSTKKRKKVA